MKSLLILNVFAKEITLGKMEFVKLVQLQLTSTLSLNHAKATSFVQIMRLWSMAIVNVGLG